MATTNKMRAEINTLTTSLYDWHAGRITQRQWRYQAGECATAEQIERLEQIGKYSYTGRDGLAAAVAKAYLQPVG